MKIKNFAIIGLLQSAMTVNSLKMSGTISMAIVKSRKKLVDAHNDFEAAKKQIFEARAVKDDNENFILSKETNEYTFETEELKKEALDEADKIGMQEIELTFDPIDENLIKAIPDISPEQMFVIMELTK